ILRDRRGADRWRDAPHRHVPVLCPLRNEGRPMALRVRRRTEVLGPHVRARGGAGVIGAPVRGGTRPGGGRGDPCREVPREDPVGVGAHLRTGTSSDDVTRPNAIASISRDASIGVSIARFNRTLARRIAIGACFASLSENPRTSAENASFSTALVTRPSEAASSAVRRLPSITSSFAFAWPRIRTSLWLPPAPGTRPRLTSVCPSLTRLAAMRKSHARANSRPPPKQWPLI